MTLQEKIKLICDAYGVSGDEFAVSPLVADILKEYCDKVEIDEMGNCVGYRYSGKPGAKKIMMDAHIDQIGLIVSDITKEGFLRVIGIGVDPRMMPGNEMVVITRNHGNLYGVCATMPPHLQSGDKTKAMPLTDCVIDVGMDYDQVVKMIQPGDYVAFAGRVMDLGKDKLCGKAMDDRACLCCTVHALDLLKGKEIEHDLIVCASVKEEVGGHGAQRRTFVDQPDLAIAIDVTHAVTPDSKHILRIKKMNEGPVVSIGSNATPRLARRALQLAKEQGIKVQPTATPAGSGTNAWTMQVIDRGQASMVISLPEKYMHTPVEVLSMEDVRSTGALLAAIAQDGRFFE